MERTQVAGAQTVWLSGIKVRVMKCSYNPCAEERWCVTSHPATCVASAAHSSSSRCWGSSNAASFAARRKASGSKADGSHSRKLLKGIAADPVRWCWRSTSHLCTDISRLW